MVDIKGTTGNDNFIGTSGDDRLEGLEGNDILNRLPEPIGSGSISGLQ